MKIERAKRVVTRVVLVVSLLIGLVSFTGTTVQAQGRHRFDRNRGRVFIYPRGYWHHRWYGYDRYGLVDPYYQSYYYPTSHVTEGQGHRDGLDDGKDDARDRKPYDPYRHKDYKNAVTSAYIDGYLRGYADGYHQAAG
jgi:hypothetical protein